MNPRAWQKGEHRRDRCACVEPSRWSRRTRYPAWMNTGRDFTLDAGTGRSLAAFIAEPAIAEPASAEPPTPTLAPAVIVVHEIMGLNDDIRRIASRFADNGYIALAPDLIGAGWAPICIARFFQGLGKVGTGRPYREMRAFHDWLAKQPGVDPDRVGMAGFCAGGGFALLYAARRREEPARHRPVLRRPARRRVDHPGRLPDRGLVRRPGRVLRQERPEAPGGPGGCPHPARREDLPGGRPFVHEPAHRADGHDRSEDADACPLRRSRLGGCVEPGARVLRRAPRGEAAGRRRLALRLPARARWPDLA